MLAVLAARFVTEGQKIALRRIIEQAAYLAVRGVEAISKAETSHDLVAANVAFHLLAERAIEAGKVEGAASEKRERARAGAAGKVMSLQPVRNEAFRLALAYAGGRSTKPSRSSVVKAIKDEVLSFAASINKPLSPDQAFTTIDKWLKEMSEANTLFASRHTPLTG